jgi:uncharacterized membrane protein YraQ (UPF0718 family)
MIESTAIAPRRRLLGGTLLFAALAIVGLAYVKWAPYWNKAHVAAATHAIGTSIVSGKAIAPPAVGWQAALDYAAAYFNSVWEAVVLGLLLGAAIQVFVPRRWLYRLLGVSTSRSAAVGSVLSLGGMMCTCCTAPIVVGMRNQRTNIGGALAFLLGNPVLNPAVLIFIGFVLGWHFTLIRLLSGVAMIVAVVAIANRLAPNADAFTGKVSLELAPIERSGESFASIALAFGRELWREVVTILPGYVAIVFLLGAFRAWLFPAAIVTASHGIGGLALLALAGTAFVIPTAGEVPIVQTLLAHGIGTAGAVVLLVTLPAISLPSLYIVRSAFPKRVLAATFAAVAATGLLSAAVVAVVY